METFPLTVNHFADDNCGNDVLKNVFLTFGIIFFDRLVSAFFGGGGEVGDSFITGILKIGGGLYPMFLFLDCIK